MTSRVSHPRSSTSFLVVGSQSVSWYALICLFGELQPHLVAVVNLAKAHALLGQKLLQVGKNLLEVQNVLGTGGIFKYGKMPEQVLKSALYSLESPWSLKPLKPKGWLDADYVMYAVGLLSQMYPDEALTIAKQHLRPLALETEDMDKVNFEIDGSFRSMGVGEHL